MTGQPAPDGAVLRGGGRPGGLAPTLSGTGLLADDLFLMAHDEVTGRAFLHRRALGLGLAGGLLAELMLPGLLGMRQGQVVAASAAGPADPLGRVVLGHVLAEREGHQIRAWLTFLARTSVTDVALRLERAGYLAPAGGRWPRRGGRLVAADPDCAFASVCRGRAALATTGQVTAHGVTLAGLALACGLGHRLLPYARADSRQRLDQLAVRLAPDVRELIAHTQAAVDSALLSHWA